VVASAGDGTVRFFDASSLTPIGSIALGDDADNVRVDPKTGQVVVGYGSGALGICAKQTARVGRVEVWRGGCRL
jgi:hypothetical protein